MRAKEKWQERARRIFNSQKIQKYKEQLIDTSKTKMGKTIYSREPAVQAKGTY